MIDICKPFSLNRISPSKLSVCNSKETNGVALDKIPAGSDSSGCQKDDLRSMSSDEFLAMERSAELDEPLAPVEIHTPIKEIENPIINGKCHSKYVIMNFSLVSHLLLSLI